jgi:hypothetical protein
LKASISTLKVTHEQEFQEQKSRLQLEEIQKVKDLEDKLRNMQKSKEDVEVRYNHQNVTILDLQQKMYSSTLEIETLKRNIDSLRAVILNYFKFSKSFDSFFLKKKKQLSDKENELIENIEKLKTDQAKR